MSTDINKIVELIIDEVSFVDDGANEESLVVLTKRQDGNTGFKTENGISYPIEDYAFVGDTQRPTTWKLRMTTEPGGEPDPDVVGAAMAALGPKGFRGNQVKIPDDRLAEVKANVLAAWRKLNPDKDETPLILKIVDSGDTAMTEEEVKALIAEAIKEAMMAMNKTEDGDEDDMDGEEKNMDDMQGEKKEEDKEEMKEEGKVKDEEEEDPVEKRKISDVETEIMKRLDEQAVTIKKQRDELEAMTTKSEVATIAKRASTEYGSLPCKPEEIAKALHPILASHPEQSKIIEKMLAAGNAAIAKNLGVTLGSDATDVADTAYDQLRKRATVIQKEQKITSAQAFVAAKDENPELWIAHRSGK